MSSGPVSGNGIPITLPPGKTVFWTVNTQAAWDQFVVLADSQGHAIFTASGSSPGGHSPTQIGAGTFVAGDATGKYKLIVGINGGQSWSQVIWDEITLSLGGTVLSGNYNFIAEDGADQDFNDTHVSLTWFNQLG